MERFIVFKDHHKDIFVWREIFNVESKIDITMTKKIPGNKYPKKSYIENGLLGSTD